MSKQLQLLKERDSSLYILMRSVFIDGLVLGVLVGFDVFCILYTIGK